MPRGQYDRAAAAARKAAAAQAQPPKTKVKVDLCDALIDLMHTYVCELNDEGRRFVNGAQALAMAVPAFTEQEAPEEATHDET